MHETATDGTDLKDFWNGLIGLDEIKKKTGFFFFWGGGDKRTHSTHYA